MLEPNLSIYDIVHIKAAVSSFMADQHRDILSRHYFHNSWYDISPVWRPTEIEALLNIGKPKTKGTPSTRVDIEWLQSDLEWFRHDPVQDNDELVGRKCPECRARYALTAEHWHHDGDGWQTVCKLCRNGARRKRYAKSVGGVVREYRRANA